MMMVPDATAGASTSSSWEEGDEREYRDRVRRSGVLVWSPRRRGNILAPGALSSPAHHPHERCPFLVNLLPLFNSAPNHSRQTNRS
jgi:hypothetical protein